MDAFLHMRINKGRVRLIESGQGVRIEIVGMMINERITIEVSQCQTLEVKPLCMTQKFNETSQPGQAAIVQPPERPSEIPQAPPPPQFLVGLTARRGHGVGKRDGN